VPPGPCAPPAATSAIKRGAVTVARRVNRPHLSTWSGLESAHVPFRRRAGCGRSGGAQIFAVAATVDLDARRWRPRCASQVHFDCGISHRTSAPARNDLQASTQPAAGRAENGTCAESNRDELGRCGCPSRRPGRGAELARVPAANRAAGHRCHTSPDPRSTRAIRCRSPFEPRRGCHRFARRACSARSDAPSPGPRSIAFGWSTSRSSRTTATSSSREMNRAGPAAASTGSPSDWRWRSIACWAARERSSAIDITPARSRRHGRRETAWSTCC